MSARAPFDFDPGQIRRLDVDDYHRMIDAGVLGEDDRVELLEGLLISGQTPTPAEAAAITAINTRFVRAAPDTLVVRCQLPLTVGDATEPEPDVAVASAPDASGRHRHPRSALLVVEVAHTSLRIDRVLKTRLYAAAAIPEYWIVDVTRRAVEIYRDPDAAAGVYRTMTTASGDDELTTSTLPGLRVRVGEILG
jgi:Uma2 family endonuclease